MLPHIWVPLNVFVVFRNNSCSVTFHCNPKILTNLTRFFVLGLNDFRDRKNQIGENKDCFDLLSFKRWFEQLHQLK